MAERSFGVRGVEEVEALSDWEIVQRIESLRRGVLQLKVATQGFVRAMNGLTAQLGAFTEALGPALGQRLADEVELYLAIDHSE